MASVMVSAIRFSDPALNSLIARIARLYGLTRDELRYIFDPADEYGLDFLGERMCMGRTSLARRCAS